MYYNSNMPTYDYRCNSCNHKFEEFQFFNDDPLVKCPNCNKNELEMLITGGLGFSVKGVTTPTQASALGGRYIPMDSAEQKFEARMKELGEAGEI